MDENYDSDVDKGSHPRLLTLTDGSRHTAGSHQHQPVVNGAPLKQQAQSGHPRPKTSSV
jgi:hypothetical protein